MKQFFTLILAFFFLMPVYGQKELKTIKKYLKDKKAKDAMQLIQKLENDTTHEKTLALFSLAKEAQIALHQVENEKNYLSQKYDTIAFFKTTLGVVNYIWKCDSLSILKESKKKETIREENNTLLQKYYSNLNAAGRWFFKKGKYEDARIFFKAYIEVPRAFEWDSTLVNNPSISSAAYLYLKSSFFLNDFPNVFTYNKEAYIDSTLRQDVLESLAISSDKLCDTVAYKEYLIQGVEEFPHVAFFFTHLTDYFNQIKDYKTSLKLADSMLMKDPVNPYFMMGKSLSLMNLKEYEQCIKVSEKILEIDSSMVETYFNIGACYCNLAKDVDIPGNINSTTYRQAKDKLKKYYQNAQTYLEKYRLIMPEEKEKWAPLLYRVYLNLNLGKQFEEVDQILQEIHDESL